LSRPQGHGAVGKNMSLKNALPPPRIDPGTIRLVTQHLNYYATPCPGKAISTSITYSDYVSVAFGIEHAMRMRRIILLYVACLAVTYIGFIFQIIS